MVFCAAFGILLLIILPGPQPRAAAPAAPPADELVGLWKAKRWFGPDARGPLVIQRKGTSYSADMMGRVLPVRVEGGELTFDLPNARGRFRGKLPTGGALPGHWYPPQSLAMGGHATPVTLKPDGPNRWSGEVVPFDDVFTFHLLVQKRPDGSLSALLGNPERNFGAQIGVERLIRDGNDVKLMGKRQGQTEERELARGTWDPENRMFTLSFPNRGGTYDFRRDDDDQSDFYPRGKNPPRYVYSPPPARDDGWPTGTLEEVNIDRAGIEALVQVLLDPPMELADTPKVHALLIARHGRLVLEEYFHGEHRDKLHETRSAAKSVTAVLVGAAIHAGAPLRLSDSVYQIMNGGAFPPDLDPQKRSMTLEHLLTMSSGYYCDDTDPNAPGNEEIMQDQADEPDWYRYTLKVPMATPPGVKAVYCSASPNLALGMVGRATGESPLDTFDHLVGGPMRITHYGWPMDPAGNPYGGGGVQLFPRDFMKFGQLMLNDGTWQGGRILSSEFAARAAAPLYHLRGLYYGYLWWGIDYPYKDRTVRAFYAGGNGGQSVIVMPQLDLVIATHGGNYNTKGTFYVQMEITPRYLLPAVREPGDDRNAPVVPREDYKPKLNERTESGPVATPR